MSDNHGRGRGGDGDAGARITYFAIGAVVGAAAALLFAPKSGRELREDLADATRKGVDRARETGSQLSSRAGEYYETAASRAGDLASGVRDAASRRGERLSAAVEAGKQAYRDEKRRTEFAGGDDGPLSLEPGS
ncbi:MAG TPA: YtxH domain-containing protein [Pyrinomonadaceae bacterium]|jgi:gas vesicle protein|nr:YtxH domain-containing protein [Pyrinomonadaceae bacterium]